MNLKFKSDSAASVVVFFAIALLMYFYAVDQYEEIKAQKALSKCHEPAFMQAVGHRSNTTWVYGCSDGSMIELPQPLPSAPIGTPDGWAGGR
jgi:hypothetical protein